MFLTTGTMPPAASPGFDKMLQFCLEKCRPRIFLDQINVTIYLEQCFLPYFLDPGKVSVYSEQGLLLRLFALMNVTTCLGTMSVASSAPSLWNDPSSIEHYCLTDFLVCSRNLNSKYIFWGSILLFKPSVIHVFTEQQVSSTLWNRQHRSCGILARPSSKPRG